MTRRTITVWVAVFLSGAGPLAKPTKVTPELLPLGKRAALQLSNAFLIAAISVSLQFESVWKTTVTGWLVCHTGKVSLGIVGQPDCAPAVISDTRCTSIRNNTQQAIKAQIFHREEGLIFISLEHYGRQGGQGAAIAART